MIRFFLSPRIVLAAMAVGYVAFLEYDGARATPLASSTVSGEAFKTGKIRPAMMAPDKMKPLGIIGGTSWRATADYYQYINQSINDFYGNNTNPPLIIFNINQRKVNDLQDAGRWNEITDIYANAVMKLRLAGASAVIFAANTPYKLYPEVSRRTKTPILHIADATGLAIEKKHLSRVGLIGTSYTMEDPFIREWLKKYYNIDVLVPKSPKVRNELQRLIHEELGMGIFRPVTKRYILSQIAELRARGAQGIVLGCTEFPLIIKQSDVAFPVFDTTKLHAQMAMDFIQGNYRPRAAMQ